MRYETLYFNIHKKKYKIVSIFQIKICSFFFLSDVPTTEFFTKCAYNYNRLQDFISFLHQLFLLNIPITEYNIKYIVKFDNNRKKFYTRKSQPSFIINWSLQNYTTWHKLILSREIITVFTRISLSAFQATFSFRINIAFTEISYAMREKRRRVSFASKNANEKKKKRKRENDNIDSNENKPFSDLANLASLMNCPSRSGQSVFRRLRLWYEIWLWEHYRGLEGIKIHISLVRGAHNGHGGAVNSVQLGAIQQWRAID